MSDIEWVDDVPEWRWGAVRRQEMREFADQLRANPGRWAVYKWASTPTAVRAAASRINRGKNSSFKEGFQAVSRNGVTYVRYMGGS